MAGCKVLFLASGWVAWICDFRGGMSGAAGRYELGDGTGWDGTAERWRRGMDEVGL